MPTPYTPPLAGSPRDRAGPGHDVSVTSARDVTVDHLSENQAARPQHTLRQVVLNLMQRCWRAYLEQHHRENLRVMLHELSERELMDIGLTRSEIEYIAAHRAIDKLRERAADPWMR